MLSDPNAEAHGLMLSRLRPLQEAARDLLAAQPASNAETDRGRCLRALKMDVDITLEELDRQANDYPAPPEPPAFGRLPGESLADQAVRTLLDLSQTRPALRDLVGPGTPLHPLLCAAEAERLRVPAAFIQVRRAKDLTPKTPDAEWHPVQTDSPLGKTLAARGIVDAKYTVETYDSLRPGDFADQDFPRPADPFLPVGHDPLPDEAS